MNQVMRNVTSLGLALEKIEALVEEMGGFIEPSMELEQSLSKPEGIISVKTTLCFDLSKLNEYIAQPHRQATGTDE
jgi:hypothetical protein